MIKEREPKGDFQIENWRAEDADAIYEKLEVPNWPPWLVDDKNTLLETIEVFPQGQFLIRNQEGLPIACLSTNRLEWKGAPNTAGLPPSWDYCAGIGDNPPFKNIYNPEGNALEVRLCVRSRPNTVSDRSNQG